MHRIIRDHLEQVLAGPGVAPEHPAGKHLMECAECCEEVTAMREQAAMLQELRSPEIELRPGFYARVLDCIEAQRPSSVFTLFFDSMFGRRIAMASLALALLLGVYVISSEQMSDPSTFVSDVSSALPEDLPTVFADSVFSDNVQPRLMTSTPDQNAVLVNLVTYREQ